MNFLATRRGRIVLFTALYASEGAPIGFVWWALPTLLREQGVGIADITTLTAILALPWAFKFFWSPIIDAVRTPRWGLRAWIASAQVVMGLSLLPLLALDYRDDFALVFALLVLHAFAAATQDVAVDALSISTVPVAERGSINGWMQAGVLTGRALLGGAGLVVAQIVGQGGLVIVLVAVVWSSLILLAFARTAHEPPTSPAARLAELWEHIRAALQRRQTWLGLGFAAVGGAGFEAVGVVAGPFLIDRGASSDTVGFFFTFVSVPCMVTGALAGGLAADRLGKVRAVTAFLVCVFVSVCLVAFVDIGGGDLFLPVALGLVYVAIGLFTASSYALFMDLTDARIAATQFSAFMALTNACESWAAFGVGRGVAAFGYPTAFLLMAALSLLGLPLLRALRR